MMRIALSALILAVVACEHPREGPATLTPTAAAIVAASAASSTPVTDLDSANAVGSSAPQASDTSTATPTGAELLKLIKRLPADSLPELPRAVRKTLDQRHCLVPQAGPDAHNVVTGAFSAKDAVEWAVLCSVHDTSTILVLNAATGALVDSTETTADVNWVENDGDNRWSYMQTITAVAVSELNTPADTTNEFSVDYSKIFPKPIDHEAIGHWFEGKGGETLYLSRGHWYSAENGD
jgi:hypothetical protein